mmetsp:Transcript_39500/g.126622  ORF Transcript_39500/g.126622 Transcript_39500/m.126622 type:complete len:263 (+) Transcript_39500:1621-2409(+)
MARRCVPRGHLREQEGRRPHPSNGPCDGDYSLHDGHPQDVRVVPQEYGSDLVESDGQTNAAHKAHDHDDPDQSDSPNDEGRAPERVAHLLRVDGVAVKALRPKDTDRNTFLPRSMSNTGNAPNHRRLVRITLVVWIPAEVANEVGSVVVRRCVLRKVCLVRPIQAQLPSLCAALRSTVVRAVGLRIHPLAGTIFASLHHHEHGRDGLLARLHEGRPFALPTQDVGGETSKEEHQNRHEDGEPNAAAHEEAYQDQEDQANDEG